MDKAQELEWLEAQKIVVSVDLKAAAKKQLQFLAAVDRNRCLYDGPILNRAIYRYKNCWLPLLAKHGESEVPLVVPLDCEWIWHCHRLNPVQYKTDCEKFYGRILDNLNVVSVVEGTSKQKTAEIWKSLYPEEPYELAFNITSSEGGAEKSSESVENIKYDLVSAVRRQSVFFYQVSRPSMHDDCFLEGAVARYKGFLHLIKRNAERSMKRFCVPTYDIDLIWHSHQLQPVSYCKDLVEALGKVLEHDDTDSDRTKGKKLDTGFSGTTKQWEETFGQRYWRAGAMYRGSAPSPVTVDPWPMNGVGKNVIPCTEYQKYLQLPQKKVVEVLLEIVGIKNLPAGHKGSLSVFFSKSQPDSVFKTRRVLSISAESGQKQVAAFQCEPTEKLVFALKSRSPSHLPISRAPKTMGTTSISLQDLLEPISELSVDKWFELAPSSGHLDSKPISLHIAVSFTVPTIAPLVFHMIRTSSFSVNNCFFPLPGRVQPLRGWTCVVDDAGNELMSIQMRNSEKTGARNNHTSKREVVGVIGWPGETHVLAESVGTGWALLDSSLHLEKKSSQDGHIFELRGYQMVKLFRGRKLDYEPRCCHQEKPEQDFMTAVRFSTGDPYGKAVALFNLKSGLIKVNEEWFAMPSIVLSFILSDILRKEGYNGFVTAGEASFKEMAGLDEEANGSNIEGKDSHDSDSATEVAVAEKGSGCGVGCGSGCGNDIKSSGCDRHVSGNGNDIKSSGCGGCGAVSGDDIKTVDSAVIGGGNAGCSDCGVDNTSSDSMVRSGGRGGCGAGCGNDIKSARGIVINAGIGNGIKSSGCGMVDGGTSTQPAGKLESISAMPSYKDKSHEELRWEDYQRGDKGGPNPTGQPAGGIFSAPTQSNPFGPTGTFGQTPANPFSSTSSNPFAQKTPTFGNTGFGSSSTPAFNSPFGTSSSSPFRATSTPTPSIFGAPSAPAFGASSSPSPFGASSMPSIGSSPSLFGSASAPGTGPAFGSSFSTQSSGLFQSSTPSLGQMAPPFVQTPLFGQTTPPSFGQTNLFNPQSTGFGGNSFTSNSSPSLLGTNNPVGFGQTIPSLSSAFQLGAPAQSSGAFSFGNFGQTSAASSGFGGTSNVFGQGTFGQFAASQNNVIAQPVPVQNPFGTLPAMPQMLIGHAGSAPSVQYGISSMPVGNKPTLVRVSPLLTPRHLSQRRIRLPARKYHPRNDGLKVPFFSDDEETPSTPKADALFIPRENPRALVIRPMDQWPTRSSAEKQSPLKDIDAPVHQNGINSGEASTPALNSSFSQDHDVSPSENGLDRQQNVSPAKSTQKPQGTHEDHAHKGNSYITISGHRAGEAAIVYEHGADIEALMPKLRHADYYTEPRVQELAAKERAEPGYCRHVKDFVVGRHSYGSIKFLGVTDVRRLDLESLIQFNNREVIVYMDENKKPPIGQGLNKPAEVTLLNIKCINKKTGEQYTEGPKVEKYKEMLMKKTQDQGAQFISYDPVKGEWKFKVDHFSRYEFCNIEDSCACFFSNCNLCLCSISDFKK